MLRKMKEKLITYSTGWKKSYKSWAEYQTVTDEEVKKKIANEFEAVATQFDDENNPGLSGGAYMVDGNPAPQWLLMSDVDLGKLLDGYGGAVMNYLNRFAIRERKSKDLLQIHNPLFEDNTIYIRSWLREKYEIFEGRNASADSGTTSSEPTLVTSGKKGYIQGKAALQAIEAQLEQIQDVRSDMKYMLRNLKELFQDFEFDLENRDVTEAKGLSSIIKEYYPYTPWPSVYEKNESNYTKIVYKEDKASLVAPQNCIVKKADSESIDIEFTSTMNEGAAALGMTLRIQAGDNTTITPTVQKDTKLKRGSELAKATGNPTIIIKLSLFSGTKQIVKVEDYMKIENKSYDNGLEYEEKALLYGLLSKEVGDPKGEYAYSKANAIVNVILNRINSTSKDYSSKKKIKDIIGSAASAKEAGFEKFAANFGERKC